MSLNNNGDAHNLNEGAGLNESAGYEQNSNSGLSNSAGQSGPVEYSNVPERSDSREFGGPVEPDDSSQLGDSHEYSDATIVRPVVVEADVDDATIVRPLSSEPQFDEATMVRPAPRMRAAASDAIFQPGREPESNIDADFDDATIVRPTVTDVAVDDATIVRPLAAEVIADDSTVVRPRLSDNELDDEHGKPDSGVIDADATVIRELPAAIDTEAGDTAPKQESRRAARKRRNATPVTADSISSSVALPVEDPEQGRRWGSRKQQGLDPLRHISPVPGSAPWDPEPMPERGVRSETTVVYGPRSTRMGDTHSRTDRIHAQLGEAPASRPVAVRPERDKLPSLEARARHARMRTLITGGVLVVVSIAGLWVIAVLALK